MWVGLIQSVEGLKEKPDHSRGRGNSATSAWLQAWAATRVSYSRDFGFSSSQFCEPIPWMNCVLSGSVSQCLSGELEHYEFLLESLPKGKMFRSSTPECPQAVCLWTDWSKSGGSSWLHFIWLRWEVANPRMGQSLLVSSGLCGAGVQSTLPLSYILSLILCSDSFYPESSCAFKLVAAESAISSGCGIYYFLLFPSSVYSSVMSPHSCP